ncbi:hypothetical protein LCL89_09820 [Halobacillus yeomjeoni]|uniref:hypothetical protein n=1 Tax=Halobacillus yeomjeoni TaxID=311194 RepID=UPI001CD369DD|nr:hypothetical protein [Halobacillus yeomjeoni]MCA0984343.1 hypothetical protein [Halobacillus yeomjeoni]
MFKWIDYIAEIIVDIVKFFLEKVSYLLAGMLTPDVFAGESVGVDFLILSVSLFKSHNYLNWKKSLHLYEDSLLLG